MCVCVCVFLSASDLFCGESESVLCGMGNLMSFLSQVITFPDGVLDLSGNCASDDETGNGAAVFAESFGGTCPESEEACFPLQPLDNDNSQV